MEAQLATLQNEARSGVGKTLIIPEPARTVRFIIRSQGPPTGGEIQIECRPMKAPGAEKLQSFSVSCHLCPTAEIKSNSRAECKDSRKSRDSNQIKEKTKTK
jgi:hypothetical protein